MSTIASKIFELVRTDANNAPNEFMLAWLGRSGEPYQYLFYDWEELNETETTPINQAGNPNVRTLPNDAVTTVQLIAEDITADQFEAFKSLAVSKYTYRLYRTGVVEPVAVVGRTFAKRQNAPRYDFTAIIQLPKVPLFE